MHLDETSALKGIKTEVEAGSEIPLKQGIRVSHWLGRVLGMGEGTASLHSQISLH